MWIDLLLYGGSPLLIVFMMSLWYRNTSRQYRTAIRDGVLICERRSLLMPWRWVFNHSMEDRLVRMKNRLTAVRHETSQLMKMIPEEEDRLKKAKEKLRENSGGTGVVFRDRWMPRRDPAVIQLNVDLKPKKKDSPTRRKTKPLLELRQPD